jgi:hypothetical protein
MLAFGTLHSTELPRFIQRGQAGFACASTRSLGLPQTYAIPRGSHFSHHVYMGSAFQRGVGVVVQVGLSNQAPAAGMMHSQT